MEIPLYRGGYKHVPNFYLTCENIIRFDISGVLSILRFLEDNKDEFIEKEIQFIKELIESENLDNLIIAISIINAK